MSNGARYPGCPRIIRIMKIGILTLPLHSNYGGLLQAWALQKALVDIGHEAIIINRVTGKPNIPLWRKFAGKVKNEIFIGLGKRKRYITITNELKKYSEQNVIKFRQNRYLGVSPELKSNKELLNYITTQEFDAYIVGSDQVWRPIYSPNLMTYFLDFVKDNSKVKKIAYAASFGVDDWEFTKKETKEAANLAPLFDLITVRESSGVKLVKEHFKCEATHVLDPTMLIDKEDYIKLVEDSTCDLQESTGDLFCYVLDKNPELTNVIDSCSKETGLKPYFCNYDIPLNLLETENDKEKCIVPPVEQWIKSFIDAKMVITDSFHGCVFSIIFNKPFWVISNSERGSSRFSSLLTQFGLGNRMVINFSKIDWNQDIDWDKINKHRELHRKDSTDLLLNAIKS